MPQNPMVFWVKRGPFSGQSWTPGTSFQEMGQATPTRTSTSITGTPARHGFCCKQLRENWWKTLGIVFRSMHLKNHPDNFFLMSPQLQSHHPHWVIFFGGPCFGSNMSALFTVVLKALLGRANSLANSTKMPCQRVGKKLRWVPCSLPDCVLSAEICSGCPRDPQGVTSGRARPPCREIWCYCPTPKPSPWKLSSM